MDAFPIPPGLPGACPPPQNTRAITRLGRGASHTLKSRARFLQRTALQDAAHLASLEALRPYYAPERLTQSARDISFLIQPGEIEPLEPALISANRPRPVLEGRNAKMTLAICAALPRALDNATKLQMERLELIRGGSTLAVPDTSGSIPAWLYLPSNEREVPELTLETAHGTYILVFAEQVEAFLTQTPPNPVTTSVPGLSRVAQQTPCQRSRLLLLTRVAEATDQLTSRIKQQLLANGVGPVHSEAMSHWVQNFVIHALSTVPSPDLGLQELSDGLDAIISVLEDVVGPTLSLEPSPLEDQPSPAFEIMASRWQHVLNCLNKSEFGTTPDIPRAEPDRQLVNLNCALSLAVDRAGF